MPLGRDRRQRRRRAAVIAGGIHAANKHRDGEQAEEPAEAEVAPQEEAAQPVEAGGLSPGAMERLKELGELRDQNVLTDEEFEREKAKVLGG